MQINDCGKTDDEKALFRLLRFSLDEQNAQLAAKSLLERFGSVFAISDTRVEDMAQTDGMTMNAALLVKLCFHLQSRRVTDRFEFGKVLSTAEIEEYLRGLFIGLDNETVYMISIDSEGRAVSCDFMGEGVISAADIYPRKLTETALRKNAAEVILAHNHPRGNSTESAEDNTATETVFSVMRSIGVKLRAHYVVACGKIKAIN